MGQDALLGLVGDVGSFGLIAYMVFRMTSHTIPRLAKQFAEAAKEQREDFKGILVAQRDQFSMEMQREREVHGQHVERMLDGLKDLKAEIKS